VVKPATIQTVLSVVLSHAWPIHQMDVKNVFLHVTLSETIYCMQLFGFVDSTHLDHVCHLNRPLYGLKQAPRVWYTRFTSHILSLGFVGARSDTSLFVYRHGLDTTYLLLYVDDMILIMSSDSLLHGFIDVLTAEFSMKDLSTLHHFLGVSVTQQSGGLFLSQCQYMVDILERVGMSDCKPSSTPVDTCAKLSSDGKLVSDATHYHGLTSTL
jgi:hypothetical protein